MKRLGLDQTALGRLIGAPQQVVSSWMRDEALPAGKSMVRLPAALGLSGHWLLTGEQPMHPPEVSEQARERLAIRTAGAVLLNALGKAVADLAPISPAANEGALTVEQEEKVRAVEKAAKPPPHDQTSAPRKPRRAG